MWTPFLVNIMSIHWWEELNVADKNACNYYCPTWNLTSCAMAIKVSQTMSWVPLCSLPWVQCKRWIPIRSMGCVHTHWGRPAIERCDSLSYIQSTMETIGEDNQKVGKIGQIINQVWAQGLKHDKIWAQWASSIPSENMLKRVWWCKCSKMESWRWTICYLMNCLKGKRNVPIGGNRRSYATLRCCCWLVLRFQKGRD